MTWSTLESEQESPLDSLLKEEQKLQIARAIAKLEEPANEVVILRFINELSIKEIAAICEMPIGTIKSHLHRAKIELKQLLADSGPTQ